MVEMMVLDSRPEGSWFPPQCPQPLPVGLYDVQPLCSCLSFMAFYFNLEKKN